VLIVETKPKLIKGKTPIPKGKERKKFNVPPKDSNVDFYCYRLENSVHDKRLIYS
jgi:hypothetical protein